LKSGRRIDKKSFHKFNANLSVRKPV